MFSFTANPFWRRWFGSRSERAASAFLRKLGYRILQHNFRCEFGEMDIIAVDGATVVFVEVRSTEQASTQMPDCLSIEGNRNDLRDWRSII